MPSQSPPTMTIPASDSPCHRDTPGLRPPPGRRTQWSPGNSLLLGRRARDHTTIRPTAVLGTPDRAAFRPALWRAAGPPASAAARAAGWARRPGPGPRQGALVAIGATARHRARRGGGGRGPGRGPHPPHRDVQQRRWRGVPPAGGRLRPRPLHRVRGSEGDAAAGEPDAGEPASLSPGHRDRPGQPERQPDRAGGHQERQRLRAGRVHGHQEHRQLRRRAADRIAERGPRQERGLRLGLRPPAGRRARLPPLAHVRAAADGHPGDQPQLP